MRRQIAPILQQAMRDALGACACADAIITNQLGLWVGFHVAESLRLPLVRAYTWPGGLLVRGPGQSSPDAERIDLAIGPLRLALGHSLNALLFSAGRRVIWRMFRPSINTARRQVLGLGPLPASTPFAELDRARQLLLYGFSEAVFEHARGWGDWVRTTGYWFLDRDPEWQPPTALVSFLEAGPPPVFIGFRSMATKDPEHILRVAVDALADTGQRGIIAAAWADFQATTLPPTALLLEPLPFTCLFPRLPAAHTPPRPKPHPH